MPAFRKDGKPNSMPRKRDENLKERK